MTHQKVFLLNQGSLLLKHNKNLNPIKQKISGSGLKKLNLSDEAKEELIKKVNAPNPNGNKMVKDINRKRPIRLML